MTLPESYRKEDYYSEILIAPKDGEELFQYYITYNKNKIRATSYEGFQLSDLGKYALKAWASIPLSQNEILELSLSILRDGNIENFTVQYMAILKTERNFKINSKLLQQGFTDKDVYAMLIRSDYGHGKENKHINIDLYTKDGKKINHPKNSFIEQDFDISSYEKALHYVLIQSEKHNPMVGATYWLSPFQSYPNRVEKAYNLWKELGVQTPLCMLSRTIQTKIILVSQNMDISEETFDRILEEEIDNCLKFEKDNPDSIKIEIPSVTDGFALPFNFFLPVDDDDNEVLAYAFKFFKDGTKKPIKFDLFKIGY